MKKFIRKIIKSEIKSIIKESKLTEVRFDYDRARDVIEGEYTWNNVESEGRDETRFDFKGGRDSMWISSKGKVRGNIPRNPGLRRAIKDLGIKEGKVNEAKRFSIINKARAKAALRQIKTGKRDDGMGKFTAELFGYKKLDNTPYKITDPKDLNKYDKFGLGEGKLTEAKSKSQKQLDILFKLSIGVNVKNGEDRLYKLSQAWESWNVDNDDKYDDLVDPLFAAVELVQDAGTPGKNNVVKDKEYYSYIKSADKLLKKFNKDAKKAMQLHTEGNLTEKGKGMWANIAAKRKRGEAPAKKGDPDRPTAKAWKDNTNELAESKISLNEKFASRKIQSLFGKVSKYGKDKSFLDGMARQYGIQWDQLTDDMVKGPDTKLDNKGIDIVIATKDITLPSTSTYDWRTNVGAGQLLAVTVSGKRVWIGRGSIRSGAGAGRSFIGLDKRGFNSIKDVMKIDGAQVYHLDPEEAARGAKQKIEDRKAAKEGASALMSAKKMKQDNMPRYRKALQIKAGKAGKGAIVKMLEEATKMYEQALQEKLTKMKSGMIPRDSYYADTLKTISSRYQYMVRAFEEYMRSGANIESIAVKYKDQPDKADSASYSTKYEEDRMASQAKEVKDEFNKMKMELSKLAKATEYIDVNTLGRAY